MSKTGRITPIAHPLPGERILSLSPPDATAAASTWLRRPNLFAGRALTAPTLDARARWAAGHVALRGQGLSPGVVQGLESDWRSAPGETRASVLIDIAAGRGLAANGEDVVLPQGLAADWWQLPVAAPADVFAGGGFPGGALAERIVDSTLQRMLSDFPGVLPQAGILLLQPAATERADADENDPCDRCGCDDQIRYEDWRIADAARLVFYAWPEDWAPLPPAGAQQRNRIAHLIFDAEAALAPDAVLPWEQIGVPIAVVGVNADFVPQWIDRAAVVRRGGLPPVSHLHAVGSAQTLQLQSQARLTPLWQARVEQLAEEIAEAGVDAQDPAALAARFDRLPPFGVLPRNVIDLQALSSAFFPAGFDLDAVPVPVEQLDLAMREAAGLAPLDLARSERVRVLVPVSQASWEPDLLVVAALDPVFTETLDTFLAARGGALAGRQMLREKARVLMLAMQGDAPAVPAIADDPQALEQETLAPWGPPPGDGGHRSSVSSGVHEHGFNGAPAVAVPDTDLYAWIYLDPLNPPRQLMLEWRIGQTDVVRAFWGADLIARGESDTPSRMRMDELPDAGRWWRVVVPAERVALAGREVTGMNFVLFDGRAAYGPTGARIEGEDLPWFDAQLPPEATADGSEPFAFFGTSGRFAPFEADHGVVPGFAADQTPTEVSVTLQGLQTEDAMSVLSDAERAQLVERGVAGFIDYLKSRADRADDIVDYGFVKLQTDIYRVRQLVLDTTDATRLAVSPSLAGIARAETAVASQERIARFFGELQQGGTAPGTSPDAVATRTASPAIASNATMSVTAPLDLTMTTPVTLPVTTITMPTTVVTTPTISPTPTVQLNSAATKATLNTDISSFSTTPTYTPTDITSAAPIVGKTNVRTLSIAERLQLPKAELARDYSAASRHEAVLSLVRLADRLTEEDGGTVPGLFDEIDVWGLAGDPFLPEPSDDPVASRRRPLADFIHMETRANLIGALLNAPQRDDGDEANLFSDSADMTDRSVALLRQVEGRVKRYRALIAVCETALQTLRDDLRAVGLRERVHADALAEARHDVAVARALIAEEQARLDALNARRAAVLADEVRFVAYQRPRTTDARRTASVRPLFPGWLPAPVPACLQAHDDTPDALRDMLAVVREAPAAWFAFGPTLLGRLDRRDLLIGTLQTAQWRGQLPLNLAGTGQRTGSSAAAITRVFDLQRQSVAGARAQSLQLSAAWVDALSWQGLRGEVARVVSLGDVIDGAQGRADAAREAAEWLDRVTRVCACLHAAFAQVPAALRLDWAERLSQFDAAPHLRNLASLSRFAGLDFALRRRLQGLVDWLFDQIEPSEPRAVALINDVVRMALLLASHAPVGRIVAGRLPRPALARPGLRIPLVALDGASLRVGMEAVVYRQDRIVARARVEDLVAGEATARVTYTETAELTLDESARVQFSQATQISLGAASAARVTFG